MKNMDYFHTEAEKLEVIEKFLQKMSDSEYNPGTKAEVLKSALRKFYRQVMEAERKGRSIYCSREEIDRNKAALALLNRPWFKQKRGGAKIKAEKEGRTYRKTCRSREVKPAQEPEVEERCHGKVKEVEDVVL